EGAYHLGLDRAAGKFDKWRQVFAVFMPDELRGQAAVAHYRRVRDYIYAQAAKYPGRIELLKNDGDDRPRGNAQCQAILAVEGGSAAAGSLDLIRDMHGDGVRLMTLTWNQANELGGGAVSGGGLTGFGRAAVALMNELGMIVDVSHLSDEGFYEVAEISARPFIASHSNSRALCLHKRNLTDEMFDIIREGGGLVGLNFCRYFLRSDGGANSIDILRHAEHFLARGGEKILCIGSDFDGTDMPDGVTGIESVPDLYEMFLKAGYNEDLVRDVFWGNANEFIIHNA
ncbi:MAG: membrane dipeptidase, partial [Oscillospiraceae bacterium]|nr:membrane dipeptidase [Oscillospiraceae bacterium]